MATQSLEFGYTTGQALTAKAFAIGSDTVAATADSVTERTNAEGRYLAAFTDLPSGNYTLVYYFGGTGAGSEKYITDGTTATFQPQSEVLASDIANSVISESERAGGVLDTIRATLAGITRLSSWLRAIIRSDSADAVAMSEINTGGGEYDPSTDSMEAQGEALQAIQNKVSVITAKTVAISSPVASDGTTVTVRQGDSYKNAHGEAIEWTGDVADQWPDLTGAAVKFTAKYKGKSFSKEVTVDTPTGVQELSMELTPEESLGISPGDEYEYDVQASWNSGERVRTLIEGTMIVERTVTDPPQ